MSIALVPVAARRERGDVGCEPADAQLVAAARSGDDRAFEQLYARYQRRIAAYIYGMVCDHGRAEDITQDVFIAALRRMRETDRPIAFRPWIYEIAKNACIDQFRRSRRAEEVSYDAAETLSRGDHGRLVATTAGPDQAVDAKQQLTDLCGAFEGLTDSHHQILVLRELEGLSYREIGERMGLSRPSVESTLFRARRRLSEEYDELATGRRCQRIQALMERCQPASAGHPGALGVRDRRRLARHLSYCKSCRRQARALGLDRQLMPGVEVGPPVIERVAGLLPLPLLERLRRGGGGSDASLSASVAPQAQATAAQWSAGLSSLTEPLLGGWGRGAAAAAAALAAGTVGGAPALPTQDGSLLAPARDVARLAEPASTPTAVAAEPTLVATITAGVSPAARGRAPRPLSSSMSGALPGARSATRVRRADGAAIDPSSGAAQPPSATPQPDRVKPPAPSKPPASGGATGIVRKLPVASAATPSGPRLGLTRVSGVAATVHNTRRLVRTVAGEQVGRVVDDVTAVLGE